MENSEIQLPFANALGPIVDKVRRMQGIIDEPDVDEFDEAHFGIHNHSSDSILSMLNYQRGSCLLGRELAHVLSGHEVNLYFGALADWSEPTREMNFTEIIRIIDSENPQAKTLSETDKRFLLARGIQDRIFEIEDYQREDEKGDRAIKLVDLVYGDYSPVNSSQEYFEKTDLEAILRELTERAAPTEPAMRK